MITGKRLVGGLVVAVIAAAASIVGVKLNNDYDRDEVFRDGIRRLREQYPFESLDARLPPPPKIKSVSTSSPAAAENLQRFENSITNESADWSREERLQKLHEGSVEEFVKREGFGAARMFGGYSESVFALGHTKEDGTWFGRNKTSVPQPSNVFSTASEGMDAKTESPKLLDLHFRNMLHFVNPVGFGFMKDRRNVVGFQAHQFNELLEVKPWKILRIELVGLLLDDRPRVYVTTDLPRMQEIRGVPTRSLDAFETAGLEKLSSGDTLFIRDASDGVRMLGAIQSAQQCIKCHGGERGDLLGAFSYHLRHDS